MLTWKSPIGKITLIREAYKLAKSYKSFAYRNHIKIFYKIENIEKTKWWPYFLKTAEMHVNDEKWDARKFIEAQFEVSAIYPYQLKTKKAWENYIDFIGKGEIDDELAIAKQLLNSYKLIKNWCLKNKIDFNIEKYIKDPINKIMLKRNNGPSLYFLSISKSFRNFYNNLSEEERGEIISQEKLDLKRSIVHTYNKIWKKMKDVLKEEMY